MISIIMIYTNRLKQTSAGYWVSKMAMSWRFRENVELISREICLSMFGMNLGGW